MTLGRFGCIPKLSLPRQAGVLLSGAGSWRIWEWYYPKGSFCHRLCVNIIMIFVVLLTMVGIPKRWLTLSYYILFRLANHSHAGAVRELGFNIHEWDWITGQDSHVSASKRRDKLHLFSSQFISKVKRMRLQSLYCIQEHQGHGNLYRIRCQNTQFWK